MAEYGSMFLVSALAAILFLGGWNGPVPVSKLLGLSDGLAVNAPYALRLLGCLNLFLKAAIGVFVMMWIRWTLPRLRIDQVMTTCLKYCTPIAAAMFAGVMLWQLFLPGGLVPSSFQNAAGVREGWLEQGGDEESVNEDSLSGIIPSRRIAEVSR